MSREDVRIYWSTARELVAFVWHARSWWLTPVVVIILLMTGLIIFLETSALAPFIYTLF